MTVRDKTGRHRYIGFTLESAFRPGREDLGRALSDAGRVAPGGPVQFQLTVYDGQRGIVKVSHRQKEAATAILNSVKRTGRDGPPVTIRTVVTSGTICTVKARLGIPEGPKPWERKRAGLKQNRPASR